MKKFNNLKWLGIIGVPTAAAVVAFIVLFTGILSNGGTAKVYASDLMKTITAKKVDTVPLKNDFIGDTANFSVELFKKAYTKGENSLVSPTSVFLALGMTANGADGNTLKEFEALLGNSGINIKDLNNYYNSLSKKLTTIESGKVNIANSIWYRQNESLNINQDFLQTNSNYYNASAYKADFNSTETVKDINNWVKNNTGNLIDKIIDNIDGSAIMYLINAVYFEDQWKKPYAKEAIRKDNFKLIDGTMHPADFMYSEEVGYLKDNKAQGFIKPYKNGKYSFVALLPNEGIAMEDYVASLSGDNFTNLMKNKSGDMVSAALPKFKSAYEIKLKDSLMKMGLKDCFHGGKANFTKMGSSNIGNIYVDTVLHKTFITVDDKGTKAGAVTSVEMRVTSMPMTHSIILNRPFVYAIVDNETNLPLFIGTMLKPEI